MHDFFAVFNDSHWWFFFDNTPFVSEETVNSWLRIALLIYL